MRVFELVHKVKNPSPGVAIRMHVAVNCLEGADQARMLAATKAGLEVPNAWLDPVASSCKQIAWAFPWNVERGVLIVQKA